MIKKKIKYERHAGNMLPPSSEKGQPFVDFNKVMKRRLVKKVRIKK